MPPPKCEEEHDMKKETENLETLVEDPDCEEIPTRTPVPAAPSTGRVKENVSLMDVIEAATEELHGIRAVCTANILQALWNWSGREDLEAARESIDWLLSRMEE